MKWYWKVRIYNSRGDYSYLWIETKQNFKEIRAMQKFYKRLTSCSMIIEEMSPIASSSSNIDSFFSLWSSK